MVCPRSQNLKEKLGTKAKGRKIIAGNGEFMIRETQHLYVANFGPKKVHLSFENTLFWDDRFIKTNS